MIGDIASTFFGGIWKLLIKTDFPGLGVSIAGVMISILLIRFSIRIFGYLTGFGANGADYGKAADGAEKVKNSVRWKNRNKIGF